MVCINCENDHVEKFCPNCGEKSNVSKITLTSILNEAIGMITQMDKGFFFNLKNLFLKPKEVVLGYIQGRRKNIYNPISYLVIAITIYLIIDSQIVFEAKQSKPLGKSEINSIVHSMGMEAGRFIYSNLKYFWILSIFWLSISTRFVFRRFNYNYAEHLAINSFVIGQATLVGIIGLWLFKFTIIFSPVIYFVTMWMTYKIFKTKDKDLETFLESIGSTIFFFILIFGFAFLIGMVKYYFKSII